MVNISYNVVVNTNTVNKQANTYTHVHTRTHARTHTHTHTHMHTHTSTSTSKSKITHKPNAQDMGKDLIHLVPKSAKLQNHLKLWIMKV